jgi:carboxyl-terminal processing protease
MKDDNKLPRSHNVAWLAVFAAAVLVTFGAFAVPQASAAPVDQELVDEKLSPYSKYFRNIEDTFEFVVDNYVDEVDPNVLYEGAMKGMLDSLGDPYTTFLDQAMFRDMTDTTTGQFGGLGIIISKPMPDPKYPDRSTFVEVVSPIDGTPGAKAGVQAGDRIMEIEGESTAPMTMEEVLGKLRGKPGTTVNIVILRGDNLRIPMSITRAMIEVPTVKFDVIQGKKGPVGYLRIIEFTDKTLARVKDALDSFKAKGYKGLIIDLRNNPGGLLQSTIKIADLFLESGVIVSTKSRIEYENETFKAKSDLVVPKDMPVVILINKGSASASEILAGALKDHKRAYLIGERSYGKGLVQQIYELPPTGFKMTVSRYYTPSDANIDKLGIPPDLEIVEPELSDAEAASYEKLIGNGVIAAWAKANPNASRDAQAAFVKKLQAEGYVLREKILARLVRDELDRTKTPPVFDLEFDAQLQAALEVVEAADFSARLAATKSVFELQQALPQE